MTNKRNLISSRNLTLSIKRSTLLKFLIGYIIGYMLGKCVLDSPTCILFSFPEITEEETVKQQMRFRKEKKVEPKIFVGMMSTEGNLNTRVKAAIDTWLRNPFVNVEIFASNGRSADENNQHQAELEGGVRVVQLPGVADHAYPPMKKFYSMIKHMYDHHLDDFDWFIRLDDDAYINVNHLDILLTSINSSDLLYIGGAGFDYMKHGENFCMGGPGIVFSRGLLRKLGPKLRECLMYLLTEHDDVEIGRCIRNVTGAQCTTSWQTIRIFFQNFNINGSGYANNIVDINTEKIDEGSIFHANKDPQYQYRFHTKVLMRQITHYIDKVFHLQKDIREITWKQNNNKNTPIRYISDSCWNALITSTMYQAAEKGMIKEVHPTFRKSMITNAEQALKMTEGRREKYKTLKSISHLFSYYNVNALFAVNNIAKITGDYEFQKPSHKKPKFPTRKLFVHQRQYFSTSLHFINEPFELDVDAIKAEALKKQAEKTRRTLSSAPNTMVNFVMSLSGRMANFARFLENFESSFLAKSENVSLMIAYFGDDDKEKTNDNENPLHEAEVSQDQSDEIVRPNINSIKEKYPQAKIELILMNSNKEFSRGLGLQLASEHVTNPNDIMFFCDVDLIFAPEILTHIRRNTIQGQQVYYPVVFSQYDPEIIFAERTKYPDHFNFNKMNGFWRYYSYGMLAIYNSDFKKTAGYDLDIQGWGLEDVLLADEIMKIGLNVFQSTEPSMVHIFHKKFCETTTTPKQHEDCIELKASHYGSRSALYYLWKSKIWIWKLKSKI